MMRYSILVFCVVSFLACSSPRKSFDPTECNETSAFERGFVEGKGGHDPDSGYSFGCREDLRAQVRTGYQRGYEKGRVEYKELLAKWEAQNASRSAHAGSGSPVAPPILYSCKINWRNLGYEATGNTLDEARSKVIDQCAPTLGRGICTPLPQCGRAEANVNPKAFQCSVQVFTRTYEAFGPTELETKATVTQLCAEKEKSDFFCKSEKIECQPNR